MDNAIPIRQIGSLDVSLVGLGCNNFGDRLDEHSSAAVVGGALDAGINLLDTADVYGGTRSEEYIGRAIGKHRPEVIIATKFGIAIDDQRKGAAPAYVRRALEDSLRRLGTDYVDLYQLHCPDPATPIADTLAALSDLVSEGKVREIGCSNFTAAQLKEAEAAATVGARFVSVQNEFSLLQREAEIEVLPECEALGMAFIPYLPLMSGLLSGKYRRGERPAKGTRLATTTTEQQEAALSGRKFDVIEALERYAADHGRTILELAIAWLAAKPTIASVIAGATKPEQVRANVKAADWTLNDKQVQEIDAIAPLVSPAT